jgi:hypothetical protein
VFFEDQIQKNVLAQDQIQEKALPTKMLSKNMG